MKILYLCIISLLIKLSSAPLYAGDMQGEFEVFRDHLQDGSSGPEMIIVPAGKVNFRHLTTRKGRGYFIPFRQFAIGRYEVTFAEYDRFCTMTNWPKPVDKWGRGKMPVINVSWRDVQAYTQWLSKQTGKKYRLPTAPEWEYAAKAGTETYHWWGEESSLDRANYSVRQPGGTDIQVWVTTTIRDIQGKKTWNSTSPVGYFSANPFGLFDTVGNVWEFTCSP